MLLVQGLIFGLIYYELFKFLIVKFNIATPGREPLEAGTEQFNVELNGTDAALNLKSNSNNSKYATMASIIYEGLGEDSNIVSIENCITRLRVEVKDINKVDQGKIKKANIPGVKVTGPNNIQVIVGPQVQFVAEEIEKLRK